MITRVASVDAHEGPVYVAEEEALYFTSLPRRHGDDATPVVAIKRIELRLGRSSVVRAETCVANGMTLCPAGGLFVCEQGTKSRPARISSLDCQSGDLETVIDNWRGQPLNSPNDVVVKSDGTIWFTDLCYGFLQGFRAAPKLPDRVYRFDPTTQELDGVAETFDKPNGLAFSADESILYVSDSGAVHSPDDFDVRRPHLVKAFDVVDGRWLARGRVFAEVSPGAPDGPKTDAAGRVYVSALSGVHIFTTDGRRAGHIPVRGAVNFAFGDGALFITNDTAIRRADLEEESTWT